MFTSPLSNLARSARLATAVLLGILAVAQASALPEDRLQAIEITADRAERNERAGFTLYSGSVVLVQGSLRIEAERLTIYHDREQADRIIALGEPARLRQQPAIDQEFVVASANQIVYQRSREVVTLQEDASIEQEGAIVSGESIRYFMAEQRVQADATADDDNARVQVFIPAEVIEEAQIENAESEALDGGDTGADATEDTEGRNGDSQGP